VSKKSREKFKARAPIPRGVCIWRKIRLIYPARRGLTHAAKAFLELVKGR
jgi:hypothetical protein